MWGNEGGASCWVGCTPYRVVLNPGQVLPKGLVHKQPRFVVDRACSEQNTWRGGKCVWKGGGGARVQEHGEGKTQGELALCGRDCECENSAAVEGQGSWQTGV